MHDAQDPFRHRTTSERGALVRRIALSIRQHPGATPRELVRNHLPELAALNFETTRAADRVLNELTRLETAGFTRRTPSAKKGQPATWEWIGGDAEPPAADEAAPAATTFGDIAARINPASQVAWKREEPALAVDERTKDGELAATGDAPDEANAIRFEEGGISIRRAVPISGPASIYDPAPGSVIGTDFVDGEGVAPPDPQGAADEITSAIESKAAGFIGLRGELRLGTPGAPNSALGKFYLSDFGTDSGEIGDELDDAFDDDDDTEIAHLRNDVAMLGDHLATLSERVGQLLERPPATEAPKGIRVNVRLPGLALDLAADTDGLSVREMRLMHNLLGSLSDAHGEDLL